MRKGCEDVGSPAGLRLLLSRRDALTCALPRACSAILGLLASLTITPSILRHPRAGQTQFCVNVTDGSSSTTACVTIVIVAPLPDAVNDTYTTCPAYTSCKVNATAGLLQNDTTPNARPITVTGNTSPSAGTVQVYANGSFEWTPPSS